MQYIYQNADWNKFSWDGDKIQNLLLKIKKAQGYLFGKMSNLGFEVQNSATLQMLTENIIKSHEIEGEFKPIADVLKLAEKAGNKNMFFEFTSTSKVTLPGAGISAVVSSEENIKYIMSKWTHQTISYDKVNQMRHVKFLKNKENVERI